MTTVFKKAWDIPVEKGQYIFPKTIDRPKALLGLVGIFFNTYGRLFPERAAKVAYDLIFSPRKKAVQGLKTLSLPTPVQERSFRSDEGTLLKAYQWGESNKIALLIHDWELESSSLFRFVQPLLEKGFGVVALDAPAHGCSEGKTICLPRYSRAIAHTINHELDTVHTIISHGIGSPSASFALRKVDPSIKVENLVLVSSPNDITRQLNKFSKLLSLPKSVKSKFYTLLEKIGQSKLEDFDTSNDFQQTNVKKVLVVHDKDSDLYSYKEARDNFFAWANASLLSTENLGHFGPIQHPLVIENIVEFIDQEQVALI